MGFIHGAQKIVNTVWHATHKTKPLQKKSKNLRKFDGASSSRLVNSWLTTNNSIDYELRKALRPLRERSRDLVKNNGYAKNFIRKVRSNVVGTKGIVLQAKARRPDGSLDKLDNLAIEEYYRKCGKKGNFDVTGKLSRADGERLFIETVARDGEVLVRIFRGYDNEVGFALQFLDVDFLDETYNLDRHPVTGNRISMSIEYNIYEKPVAYHLLRNHPGEYMAAVGQRYERVPADDIIHEFIPMHAKQSRGFPWIHAAMVGLNDLGGYREAAIIAARVGASKMGFYTSPDGAPPNADGTDENGNFIEDAEPGHFDIMPDGYGLESWDPTYPHDQFESFNKACLRGISSGIGVAYHSLANDLEGVNFASSRSGTLEERDEWMVIQDWMINAFNVRVFETTIQHGIFLSGQLNLPGSKFDKFNAPYFQARRWSWVDPKKDMDGHEVAIRNRVRSPQAVIREQGADPEEVLDEIQQWYEMLKERDIPEPATVGFLMPGDNTDDDLED